MDDDTLNLDLPESLTRTTSARAYSKMNPPVGGYVTISVSLPGGFYLSERVDCDPATVNEATEKLAKRVLARLKATE